MTLISRYCYYTAILTILTNCGQNYNDAVYVEIVVASDKNCRKVTPAMVNQYSLKTSHKSGQAPNKTPPPPTWPIWNALFLLPNNIGAASLMNIVHWTTSASVMNCKWRWMNNELWATAMKSLTRRSLTNCSYDTICFCTEFQLLMMSKCLLWSTDTGYDSDYRWTNSEDEGCLVC